MSDSSEKIDIQFFQLVLSLQAAAMQQMGKVMSPLTGKVERDLTGAKTSIDLIEMLEKKTTGNLSDDEAKMIKHVLYELRMNYVDEMNKGEADKSNSAEDSEPTKTKSDSTEEPPASAEEKDQDSDKKEESDKS